MCVFQSRERITALIKKRADTGLFQSSAVIAWRARKIDVLGTSGSERLGCVGTLAGIDLVG